MTTANDAAPAGGDAGEDGPGAAATDDGKRPAAVVAESAAPVAPGAHTAGTADGVGEARPDAEVDPDGTPDAEDNPDADGTPDADGKADAEGIPAAESKTDGRLDAESKLGAQGRSEAEDTSAAEGKSAAESEPEAESEPQAAEAAAADVAPRRRRRFLPRRRWLRVLTVMAIVLVVLAGAAVGAAALLVRRYDHSVHQESLLGAAAVPAPTTKQEDGRALIEGPLNILLVGIDEQDDDPGAGARSDSIIILHVNADHSRAYLLSIPRDTRVQLPAYPKSNYRGGTDKINAAFSVGWRNGGGRGGGFELLSLTTQGLTGLSFNAGGIVNFAGLVAVVDALGGVDMCVDEETTSIHVGWDAQGNRKVPYILMAPDFAHAEKQPGVRAQVYHVGCQHFSGWQALDYVRQRELIPDGDYGRQRHQQQLLSALAGKLNANGMLSDPFGTDKALRALGNSVTFDGNKVSLLDWIFTLRGLRPAGLTMLKTNGGQFTSETIDGRSFEATSETSVQMYAAAKDDTLEAFVAAHPDWVSK